MSQQGDPRIQITVEEQFFRTAHNFAAQDGWESTSAWLRHLLFAWDGSKLPVPRQKQLSVRLDERHRGRLNRLARRCGVSRSRAFGLLIEKALNAASEANQSNQLPWPAPGQSQARATPIAIPGSTAYQQWARLILEAARATPHKFGRKAFIAGVLDEVVATLKPDEPDALRAQLRSMLPILNRKGLVPLSRADLVSAMDADLVQRSEIQHLNATFHFVDLGEAGQ